MLVDFPFTVILTFQHVQVFYFVDQLVERGVIVGDLADPLCHADVNDIVIARQGVVSEQVYLYLAQALNPIFGVLKNGD